MIKQPEQATIDEVRKLTGIDQLSPRQEAVVDLIIRFGLNAGGCVGINLEESIAALRVAGRLAGVGYKNYLDDQKGKK